MLSTALVLAAHGSHHNARSSDPARRHVAALAARGAFEQVVAVFWKEFPTLRDVRYVVDARRVVVVPFFMAEGYFSQRVVPRELELDGEVTHRGETTIHYTAAVGSDAAMADVIQHRVLDALGPAGPPPAETAVVVVGHGTVQNRRSKDTVLAHAARLRQRGFAEVAAAFMEEPPWVAQIPALVQAESVCVVPLFAADGLHTDQDIPADLGLTRSGADWDRPSVVGGRRIYYTSAVGNDTAMLPVIESLAQRALARESA